MHLYLLRHGIAVERGTAGIASDSERPLTEQGRRRLQREAAGMRALGLTFDLIVTSPLLRAYETAQVVAEAYGSDANTVITDALAPGMGFGCELHERAPIVRVLTSQPCRSALLVGHEPDLSELASLLLTGTVDLNLQFKKGALCAIQMDDPTVPARNSLLWLLAPRQLRVLGAVSAHSREA